MGVRKLEAIYSWEWDLGVGMEGGVGTNIIFKSAREDDGQGWWNPYVERGDEG